MNNDSNPHSGHRQRMKQRLANDPLLTGFSEHEILEMLLYTCIPRANTNDIAHSLISVFGSLDGVLTATPEELVKSGRIGESTAQTLSFIGAVSGYLRRGLEERYVSVRSLRDVKDHIYSIFKNERRELFMIFGVSSGKEIVRAKVIGGGDDQMILFDPDALLREVTSFGFKDIILAHNHPFSDAEPSRQDIASTDRLLINLKDLGITVLDHLVVGETDVYSFREHGRLFDIF